MLKHLDRLGLIKVVTGTGFLLVAGISWLCEAQPMRLMPRTNGNPPLATTTAAPTANPFPVYGSFDTACRNHMTSGDCNGQPAAAALIGGLCLSGCQSYRIILSGDGGTLSGGGTVQIYAWPEFPKDAGGQNLWARNPQLDETVSVVAGTQSQIFAGHVSDGMGCIYPAPSGVTVSGGVVSVNVEAACSN